MATMADVARIASALPGTAEKTSYGNAGWAVRGKTFVWERPLRKADLAALGSGAPSGTIVGVYTDGLEMKDAILASDPNVFFTTPHFDGYAAVLIRLTDVSIAKLKVAIVDSWIVRAPKPLAAEFLAREKSH